MKTYYDLINENLIDFNKLIIKHYLDLGLTEIEAMALIKLKDAKEMKQVKLSVSKDKVTNIFIELVNKGFINLDLEDDFSETVNLDPIKKKLANILNGIKETEVTNVYEEYFLKTLKELEIKMNRILTPKEMNVIRKWYYDYRYDFNYIIEIITGLKKAMNIFELDTLIKASSESNSNTVNPKELFTKAYGKK